MAAVLLLRASLPAEVARVRGRVRLREPLQAFFHLLPIPGLDGARLVGLVLPPRAAEVYRNADAYLALFVLVVIFLLAAPVNDDRLRAHERGLHVVSGRRASCGCVVHLSKLAGAGAVAALSSPAS